MSGTTSADYVKKNYRGKITLREVPTFSECVRSLANSEVDAVSTDDVILAGFAAEPKYKGILKVVGKGFTDEQLRHRGQEGRHGDGRQGQHGPQAVHRLRRLEEGARQDGRASGYQIPEPADRRELT